MSPLIVSRSCDLCDDISGDVPVCGCCTQRMKNGECPVICLMCRRTLGISLSVKWIDDTYTDAEMTKLLDVSLRSHIAPAFVRAQCPDCVAGIPAINTQFTSSFSC